MTPAKDLRERTTPRQVLLRAGGASAQRKFGDIEAAARHVGSFSPGDGRRPAPDGGLRPRGFTAGLPSEQVEDAVAARLARQRLLFGPEGPSFTQILTEAALRWHVGSPALMAAQCLPIAEMATATSLLRVGIVPWERPVRVFPMHGFDLYDERAAIVGTKTGTTFLTARTDVATYVELFRQLTELAEFGEKAATIAARLAEKYGKLGGR